MSDNNTRRYPRTLADAFSDERASCTEGWQRPADRAVNWALFFGAIAVLLSIFFGVPV